MITVLKRLKVLLGIALCIIGIAGTLVPVVPGVPIILAGFALMGGDHPIVRSVKERFKHWFDKHRSKRL